MLIIIIFSRNMKLVSCSLIQDEESLPGVSTISAVCWHDLISTDGLLKLSAQLLSRNAKISGRKANLVAK